MVQYTLTSIDPTLAGGIPWHITTAPDGTLWMAVRPSSYNGPGNAIVRIVPTATPTATVTKLTTDASALGIGADNAGNIWFGSTDRQARPPRRRRGRHAAARQAGPWRAAAGARLRPSIRPRRRRSSSSR